MSNVIFISDKALHTIDDLKERHLDLVSRVKEIATSLSANDLAYCAQELTDIDSRDSTGITPDNNKLQSLVLDIRAFLNALTDISAIACSPENYLWICDTAIRWEHRLSSVFSVSRTVKLERAPVDVMPGLAPGDALAEDELEQRLNSLAKVVYAHRLRLSHRDDGCDKEDWHKAEVFLALDILDGTINFARRISSNSYKRLEKIWLSEIRELVAYLEWEKDGRILGDPHTLDHYVRAWNDFKKRLWNPDIKASLKEFGEAKRYLEAKYVTRRGDGYEIDKDKILAGGDANILNIKGAKIRETAGKWDEDRYWDHKRNWEDAENYVKLFYENIIPAARGNSSSAQKVINAFDYSMGNARGNEYKGARRIINAFEITLAVYFISVETLAGVTFPSE